MLFNTVFMLASIIGLASARAVHKRQLDVNSPLSPDFGVQRGIPSKTAPGECEGILGGDGNPINIPCNCPPTREEFVRSLNANIATELVENNKNLRLFFDLDDSQFARISRAEASLATLQNIWGPGIGCPSASTTFDQQLAAAIRS